MKMHRYVRVNHDDVPELFGEAPGKTAPAGGLGLANTKASDGFGLGVGGGGGLMDSELSSDGYEVV